MISEFLLNIVFDIASWLLGLLPEINFSVDSSAFEFFLGIVQVAGYMLPMGHISAIIGLIFVLNLLRIIIALIHTLWDLLPFA